MGACYDVTLDEIEHWLRAKDTVEDHRHVWALEATDTRSTKASSFNGNTPSEVLHVMSQLPCCGNDVPV